MGIAEVINWESGCTQYLVSHLGWNVYAPQKTSKHFCFVFDAGELYKKGGNQHVLAYITFHLFTIGLGTLVKQTNFLKLDIIYLRKRRCEDT